MQKLKSVINIKKVDKIYNRIAKHIRESRAYILRTIDNQVTRIYWLIGKNIVEEEQEGRSRAKYGESLITELSKRLIREFGQGYSPSLLKRARQFYLIYPKGATVWRQLDIKKSKSALYGKGATVRHLSIEMQWPLSWSHYRLLIAIGESQRRSFYEIEAIKNNWSVRELDHQINSMLFERLSKSKDKKGIIRLAKRGQEIIMPEDALKDPVILEFLGIPESHRLVESKLEEALINNLQQFLLELGKGFAFVARQKRLTLDGKNFYADLIFYHIVLKCFVIIDIKTQELTHNDLGQMQLYVNYFDQEVISKGDNPTIGLILCTKKSDAIVKYTLGDKAKQIFARKYQFHLPTEDELVAELKREIKQIKRQGL